jgi:hypothetical protein
MIEVDTHMCIFSLEVQVAVAGIFFEVYDWTSITPDTTPENSPSFSKTETAVSVPDRVRVHR